MGPVKGDTIYDVERIKLLNLILSKVKNIESSIQTQIEEAINNVVAGAPEALDTLKEIADKLSDNDDVVTQILNAINDRLKIEDYVEPVQSDWNENDDTKLSFIKNKPNVEDLLSYGIEWDITDTNPVVNRIGNLTLHRTLPIQSAFRGCVCKGAEIQYYLNPTDWSKKEDGTDSNLDGTDGTVRIHTPKFYGRSFINGNKRQVRISTVKIDNSWIEIPELVIDAYRCTLDRRDNNNIKTASVKNTSKEFRGGNNNSAYDVYLDTDAARTQLGKAVTNISRVSMRNYANNDDSELLCYEFYKWIFYWCPIIEYANFNSQAAVNNNLDANGFAQGGLGNGISEWNSTQWDKYNNRCPITPNGYSDILGNFSGEINLVIPAFDYDNNGTIVNVPEKIYKVNRYRGFENPFGDIWTNLEGIIIDANSSNRNNLDYVYTTKDKSKFGESINDDFKLIGFKIHSDGYVKEFDLRETAEIIASSIGGSATRGKCDHNYCGNQNSTLRSCFVGGDARLGADAGLGCLYSTVGLSNSDVNFGFRTCSRIEN